MGVRFKNEPGRGKWGGGPKTTYRNFVPGARTEGYWRFPGRQLQIHG